MKIEYKKADMADIDFLTKTRIQVLRAANKLRDSADLSVVEKESYRYYQNTLNNGTHIAYLVFDDDVFVGTGAVSFYTVMPTYHNPKGEKAYIMNMYTHPEYRRKGIAYKTLELLVSEAKARNISYISLEATEAGRPLYEKFGFVQMTDEMLLPETLSI